MPIALRTEVFTAWLDEERHRLLAPLEEDEAEQESSSDAEKGSSEAVSFSSTPNARGEGPVADALRSAAKMQRMVEEAYRAMTVHKPEDRSPDKYREQVEDYLERAGDVMEEVVIDRHLRDSVCDVQLVASNSTDWPYREVEIEVFIPGAGVCAVDETSGARIPSPPRIWGDRWVHPLDQFGGLSSDHAIQRLLMPPTDFDFTPGPSLRIDNSGSARLTFPSVDLAPHSSVPLELFALLVPADLAGQVISATWTARSVHVRGVDDGTLEIRVDGTAADTSELLERSEDDVPGP